MTDPPDDATRDYVRRVVRALGERLKVYSDILDARDFFVADDQLEYDEAAFKKRLLRRRGGRAAQAVSRSGWRRPSHSSRPCSKRRCSTFVEMREESSRPT